MSQIPVEQALQEALKHFQAGRLADAELVYQRILTAQPRHPEALHMAGIVAGQQSRWAQAVGLIRQAVVLEPGNAGYHGNLALFLEKLGQLDEAIASYQRSLALNPDVAATHYNLGNARGAQGHFDEAIACYQRAVTLNPRYAKALYNLGNVFEERAKFKEAAAFYQRALSVKPDFHEALNNLGFVLLKTGRREEAIVCCQRALAIQPGYAKAHHNLGNAWLDKGQIDQAIDCYQAALALNPQFAEARNSLANARKQNGQIDDAIAGYRQILAVNPGLAYVRSNLLYATLFRFGATPEDHFAESRKWDELHALPLAASREPPPNNRNLDRPLRIGYVSPDLRKHSVARFLLPLLAAHDRQKCQVYCYAQVAAPDEMTAMLQSHAHGWRNIMGLSDAAAADLIRQDQIDILVDLAGHTSDSRLLIFAHKPAPVQATWLGYPATTGLSAMDYRLTDAIADPPGQTETWHSEKLLRLAHTGWCFGQPENAPPVSELPAIRRGYVTFGCFNNFAKINEQTFELWAAILGSIPGSKLLLKAKALASASIQQRTRQMMRGWGIEPDRVLMSGWLQSNDHLALYDQVDIALDTFPYHGTTTTCEALWMGVPVVTLAGRCHVSRVGVSLLTSVALPETIAYSPQEYARLAVGLAGDLSRLAHLRSTLRQRMRESVLMDGIGFARDMEAAFREMWRTWCGGPVG